MAGGPVPSGHLHNHHTAGCKQFATEIAVKDTNARKGDRRNLRRPQSESRAADQGGFDPWLRTEQAGVHLGYSTNSLKTMRSRGVGPKFYKVGLRAVRYRRSDLDFWAGQNGRETSDTLAMVKATVGGGMERQNPRRRAAS